MNDLPLLRQVDYPYIVRRPDGTYERKMFFPGCEITAGVGPVGFSEAVDSLILLV